MFSRTEKVVQKLLGHKRNQNFRELFREGSEQFRRWKSCGEWKERDRRACCCVGENCAEEIEDETKREGDSTSEMNLSQAMAKSSNFSSAATLFLKLYC